MKLNLGCGWNKLEGFVNVDQHASTGADMLWDLEELPWPWEDNSVEEIRLIHVLEHLGQAAKQYLAIIKEIYRICKNDARVVIEVPHPLHSDFLGDPTHCRSVTVEGLHLFNLEYAEYLIENKWAGTPLAKYIEVDFNVIENLEYREADTNKIRASKITLVARKPFRGNRKPITLCEDSWGIGDVCMSMGVSHALFEVGYDVNMIVLPKFEEIAKACPYVKSVSTDMNQEYIYLSSTWLQLQKDHQVNTLLKHCGVDVETISNKSKSMELIIPEDISQDIAARFPGRNRIVISTAPNQIKSRKWPIDYWQELVNHLTLRGIEVLSIGSTDWYGQNDTCHLDGVVDVFDLSPFETVALFNHCKVMVSADSGPIHLAGPTDCGIVGIYSVMPSKWRLPFRHGELGWNAIGLDTSCSEAPCYPKMVTESGFIWCLEAHESFNNGMGISEFIRGWCPTNTFSCMENIPVDTVYSAVMELWTNR